MCIDIHLSNFISQWLKHQKFDWGRGNRNKFCKSSFPSKIAVPSVFFKIILMQESHNRLIDIFFVLIYHGKRINIKRILFQFLWARSGGRGVAMMLQLSTKLQQQKTPLYCMYTGLLSPHVFFFLLYTCKWFHPVLNLPRHSCVIDTLSYYHSNLKVVLNSPSLNFAH